MICDEDPLRRRPRESTARRKRQERGVWMARKMTEWPSKRGPITKIMPSDGCIGDTVPLAVGKWYDFHEFGWYMGNVGPITGRGSDFRPSVCPCLRSAACRWGSSSWASTAATTAWRAAPHGSRRLSGERTGGRSRNRRRRAPGSTGCGPGATADRRRGRRGRARDESIR